MRASELRTRVEALAVCCQLQATGGPVQQPDAQLRLQVGHVPRNLRLRQAGGVRRADEAAGADHLEEGTDLLEIKHLIVSNKLTINHTIACLSHYAVQIKWRPTRNDGLPSIKDPHMNTFLSPLDRKSTRLNSSH